MERQMSQRAWVQTGQKTVWYWSHDRWTDLTRNYSDWMRSARRIGDIKGQTGTRHLVKGSWKENQQGMDTSRNEKELPAPLLSAPSISCLERSPHLCYGRIKRCEKIATAYLFEISSHLRKEWGQSFGNIVLRESWNHEVPLYRRRDFNFLKRFHQDFLERHDDYTFTFSSSLLAFGEHLEIFLSILLCRNPFVR